MYTRITYSPLTMARWTQVETFKFFILAVIPVVLYEVFDLKWLHLPWLPIALIGTAVAFVIGFQNNASYGRIWEARKIWGGIVNSSRSWGIMVNDYITNEFAEEKVSKEEIRQIKKELIYRHIAWLTSLRYAMRAPKPWEHFVWLSIPFSVIVSWVFHTMERIGRTGENPFEGTANDVPITTMSRGIEIDLREMLDEPKDIIPKPIEPKYDTEM